MPLPRATAYSMCVAGALKDAPRRGLIHSAFASAANLVFPGDFVISLNANVQPSHSSPHLTPFPGMPNGIQIDGFPFAALRPGMPILLGAGRLVIDAIGCSLDLSCCAQWDACIARPANLDIDIVRRNAAWLARKYLAEGENQQSMYFNKIGFVEIDGRPQGSPPLMREADGRPQGSPPHRHIHPRPYHTTVSVTDMARALCGRGCGLTPTGDDMLAGWMAIKWLLYGTSSTFPLVTACEEIMAVARQQTHILSQCWLGYAAQGYVALPVCALLAAMTENDERQLAAAAQVVSSMGATSGRDLMRGIVMGV